MSQGFSNNEAGSPTMGCPNTGPPESSPASEEDTTHWVEIELIDKETGAPIPFEEYQITLPDGVSVHGYLDLMGFTRVTGIETSGDCKVEFPHLYKREWSKGQ